MTDHIVEANKKVIDLDALEKLADRCSFGDPWYTEENLLGRQNFGQFLPQDRAFIAAANPATIKALIAELREARDMISLVINDAFDCQEDSCLVSHRIIADARAFLSKAQGGE